MEVIPFPGRGYSRGNKIAGIPVFIPMELMSTAQPATPSFDAVSAPHLDAAYNLARWLTGDPHDAEDVVQEAWMRALRSFGGFRGGDGRAWLLAIVRNTCYSWLQKSRRFDHESYEHDEHDVAAEQPAAHQADPESLVLREAAAQLVGQGLRRIAPEFREVLVLRELEEMSYQQIADVVAVPIGTVMSRLSRARRLLRRAIESLEGSAP